MSSHNQEVMHFVYQCIFSSKTPSYPLYIIGCKNSIWITVYVIWNTVQDEDKMADHKRDTFLCCLNIFILLN